MSEKKIRVRAEDGYQKKHLKDNELNEIPIKGQEWEVTKVPTILLTDGEEIYARCTGYQPEEILELWLDAKIEERKAAKN